MNDLSVDHVEAEILGAYRALGGPVSPPDDMFSRVERGIRRRRRGRRAVAGVAALAIAGTVGVSLLGGSDTDRDLVADGGGSDISTLTATLSDGSTQTFDATDIAVACNKDGTRLWLARNAMAESFLTARGPEETAFEAPVLIVELVVADVRPGQVFELPYDSASGDTDDRALTFFFTADEGRDRDNELSSAEPGSAGTVTVRDLGCGPTPFLDLIVDATLGSEVEQPALAIKGEYRS